MGPERPSFLKALSMPKNPTWADDELILALDLYFRLNPARTSDSNPAIIELSNILNSLPVHAEALRGEKFRNPSGVYMKLCNFLRFDPGYTGKGLVAGGKREKLIWDTYYSDREQLARVAAAIREAGQRQLRTVLGQVLEDDDEAFIEGRVLTREHKFRERNRMLVNRKKQQALKAMGRLECEVCAFDFFAIYGEIGRNFAECHHTLPISDLAEARETRLSDLAIVCANCHRMLHRARPWKTIQELKKLVRKHD
jgi:5-methylcytosine-specific restriction protein A